MLILVCSPTVVEALKKWDSGRARRAGRVWGGGLPHPQLWGYGVLLSENF